MVLMTKEEIKKLFPINSIVEVIDADGLFPIQEGQTAKIIEYMMCGDDYRYVIVEWLEPKVPDYILTGGWLPNRFKLINVNQQLSAAIIVFKCPRCNGKLIKKEAEEPFTGKKYTIDKCKDCGWC